jgi:hypothetical protein
MSEEENESVQEQTPEAAAPAAESESAPKLEETQSQRKKRNDAEYNWAETRRKMEDLERQNRELAERVNQQRKPIDNSEEDELAKLANDDILTVAQARKLATHLAKKAAEEAIREREASTVDERLSTKFTDFNDVVNRDNIEILKQTEPELAMSLNGLANDPYAQGVAAYKLLKKMGIGQEEVRVPEREKAVANSKKPVSVNAVTKQSAIGNAHMFENGLTPELKKQLNEEMKLAIRQG